MIFSHPWLHSWELVFSYLEKEHHLRNHHGRGYESHETFPNIKWSRVLLWGIFSQNAHNLPLEILLKWLGFACSMLEKKVSHIFSQLVVSHWWWIIWYNWGVPKITFNKNPRKKPFCSPKNQNTTSLSSTTLHSVDPNLLWIQSLGSDGFCPVGAFLNLFEGIFIKKQHFPKKRIRKTWCSSDIFFWGVPSLTQIR